ncbi:hypothetical protein [Comamonas aquatica]|uniref:hypothetical protein n=1 Tax=Comamonas aquatica TaxID=225991 RepID=UPI00244AA007|nr:hypothetical protein [Comamonas aquatica]MDH0493341.1 hypothetical protein [Comamonas aquatica]
MSTTPLTEHRARQSLEAARRATAKDQAAKLINTPLKRCASCGAPVHQEPAEGEGLPCGH